MKVTRAQAYGYNCMLATLKQLLEMKPNKAMEIEIKATIRNKKPIDMHK